MFCLETKLAPPRDQAVPWRRDVFCLLVLACLVVVLPWWQADASQTLVWLTDQAASVYLLSSLGFLLALRCGAVDLSVWVAMGLGGVVAAWAVNSGCPVAWAMVAGIAAGAGLGVVNGLLVSAARVPSPVATLGVGVAAMFCLGWLAEAPAVQVPVDTFHPILGGIDAGIRRALGLLSGGDRGLVLEPSVHATLGRLIIAGGYLAVLAVFWFGRRRDPWNRLPGRRQVFVALSISGALGAAAGVAWLVTQGQAPVPTRVIGDLRVPVTAVLAGGLLLAGRGRTLAAVALMPLSLVVTTLWRQTVPVLPAGGYWWSMLVLLGAVLAAQTAVARSLRGGPGRKTAEALATWFVMCLLALGLTAVGGQETFATKAFRVMGMAECAAIALLLTAARANGAEGENPTPARTLSA